MCVSCVSWYVRITSRTESPSSRDVAPDSTAPDRDIGRKRKIASIANYESVNVKAATGTGVQPSIAPACLLSPLRLRGTHSIYPLPLYLTSHLLLYCTYLVLYYYTRQYHTYLTVPYLPRGIILYPYSTILSLHYHTNHIYT